jgi:hypothetical protein
VISARTAATAASRAACGSWPAACSRTLSSLAKAQNIPVEQARQQVQDYQKQYDQAVATAKQKAGPRAA